MVQPGCINCACWSDGKLFFFSLFLRTLSSTSCVSSTALWPERLKLTLCSSGSTPSLACAADRRRVSRRAPRRLGATARGPVRAQAGARPGIASTVSIARLGAALCHGACPMAKSASEPQARREGCEYLLM